MTVASRPTAHQRLLLLGGIAVPVALVASMLGATSASAAPITTKSELVAAMQSATGGATVVLDVSLRGDGGSSDVLTLPSNKSLTLDLNGHDLDLDQIVYSTRSFFTLADSTGHGAALTVGGSSVTASDSGVTGVLLGTSGRLEVGANVHLSSTGSAGRAGIGTGADSGAVVLYVDSGATVDATGGSHGAGIGSGDGAAPLTAVSITGATVHATGGAGASGIAASNVSIEDSDVTAAGVSGFGTIANTATAGRTSTLRIAAGSTLSVPSGQTMTNSGDLVVSGTLTGAGSIDNTGGTIAQAAGGTIDDRDLTVTGRNHLVAFAAGSGTVTAPATKHVYATTLGRAGLDLGAYSGTSGSRALVGWSAGGTAHVSNDDLLAALSTSGGESDPVTLTAAYEQPIVFTGAALPNAAIDQRYDRRVPVTGDATAFAAAADPASGLPSGTIPTVPPGLGIDAASGTISGSPTTGGRYSFVVTATSAHQRVSQAVTLDIAAAPVIATTALPSGTAGAAYSAPILATGGTVAFAITSGVLPGGLHLDPATGLLAGTPTSAGTFTFTASAANDFGSVEQTLSLTVAEAAILTTPVTGGSASAPSDSPGGSDSPSAGGSPASASPAAPPVLPILPTTTARLGHPLALSIAASSTVAVTYSVPAKDLPAGISLDRGTGLLFGAARVPGRYSLHVTATSSAGSSTRTYSVVVPVATRLVTGSAAAITPRAGAPMVVTIRGLLAGERWRIALNGRQVQTGIARFGGTVKHTVRLPARAKDTTHRIRVSGDRRVTDPSTVAAHELTVTAVVARKTLRLSRSGTTLTVRGLAAKERVTIRRGSAVLATGRADTRGVFVVRKAHLRHGVHTVTGSMKHRAGRLVLR